MADRLNLATVGYDPSPTVTIIRVYKAMKWRYGPVRKFCNTGIDWK